MTFGSVILVAATLALSACGATSPVSSPTNAPDASNSTVDWAKPLSVCQAIDQQLIQTMLVQGSPDWKYKIEPSIYTTRADGSPRELGCTYAYGNNNSQRLQVLLTRFEQSPDAAEFATLSRNKQCDTREDIILVRCAPADALETVQQQGPMAVQVRWYYWQQSEAGAKTPLEALQEVHGSVSLVLTDLHVISEDTEASPQVSNADALATTAWADACIFSYQDVATAFEWSGFSPTETSDQGRWSTENGREWYSPGCQYGPADWSAEVSTLDIKAFAYGSLTSGKNRATAFANTCTEFNANSPYTVTCEQGSDADFAYNDTHAAIFREDFVLTIDTSGTSSDRAIQTLHEIAQIASKKPLQDART